MLRDNIDLNRHLNITPLNLALDQGNFRKKIYQFSDNHGASSLRKLKKNFEYSQNLKTTNLDSLKKIIDFKKVKFIKIDVEGYELNVLKGMKLLIKNKIFIFFEYNFKSLGKKLSKDLIKYLSSTHFIFQFYFDKSQQLIINQNVNFSKNHNNLLAIQKNVQIDLIIKNAKLIKS